MSEYISLFKAAKLPESPCSCTTMYINDSHSDIKGFITNIKGKKGRWIKESDIPDFFEALREILVRRGRYSGWGNKIEVKCATCGNIITKYESDANCSKRHYCDEKCRVKGYRREY